MVQFYVSSDRPAMSALGHKRTFAVQKVVSALPPKADINRLEVRNSHLVVTGKGGREIGGAGGGATWAHTAQRFNAPQIANSEFPVFCLS
jgi:hypothetical protein